MSNFIVKKVAVLGAGVMGAQIAAHCVNAKVPVVLFDLPAKDGNKNGIVLKKQQCLAQGNAVAPPQKDILHRLTIDSCTIGRTKIAQSVSAAFTTDFKMPSRHLGVSQAQGAACLATDNRRIMQKFNAVADILTLQHDQLSHRQIPRHPGQPAIWLH